MSQVLLLNSTYEPLNVCSWKRAMVLVLKGKAVALEVENKRHLGGGHNLPLVVKLLYYVKIPHKAIPLTRKNLMHRDNYTCQYCGSKKNLTVDHIIPRSRGGKDEWNNVVVACLRCNVNKGSRTPKEAGMVLNTKAITPHGFMYFELSKQQHRSVKHYGHWKKYMYFQ